MTAQLLLVDFENVQQVDLAQLDDSSRIIIFLGASQKSVPIALVTAAQRLGSRVDWQRLDSSGRNALDFFIAYQLGRELATSPQTVCTILSKDKGYDPLLTQLNHNGFQCRRVNSLLELQSQAVAPTSPQYQRIVELLRKQDKKTRPRKRKTLSQYISGIFQKKIDQPGIDGIVDLLFANQLVTESNGVLSYGF